MKSSHVYQFAVRKSDDLKKQFIIEHDIVCSEHKLTKEDLEKVSKKYFCDVKVTYLGVLKPPVEEELLEVDFHTKEMYDELIAKWKEEDHE